jgi:phosphoglycerate dehydrogenase-like enzyme
MRVLVSTPRLSEADAEERGVVRVDLDHLLREADVVVVACPLKPETFHLLDARRLALLKPSAVLVNVARGAIVDQAALVAALREGRIAGAGLDVFEREPVLAGEDILDAPNVVAAPHSLAYTDQLFRGTVESACRAIAAVATGAVPDQLANPAVLENARFTDKLARLGGR